jgi:hypothetical protein
MYSGQNFAGKKLLVLRQCVHLKHTTSVLCDNKRFAISLKGIRERRMINHIFMRYYVVTGFS